MTDYVVMLEKVVLPATVDIPSLLTAASSETLTIHNSAGWYEVYQ